MLGHDYGFKRIMSSYYFQDTDQVVDKTEMIKWITRTRSKYWLQGPPGGAPASYPDICGNGWTCEHRLVQVFFYCWTFEERCIYVLYIFQVEQHHEHGTVRKQSDWPAGHQLGCELTSNNSGSNLETAGITWYTKEGKPTILQITCNYLI